MYATQNSTHRTQLPIHISARSENRQAFPIPIDDVWSLSSEYLYFIHHAYEIQIHSFTLMPNHLHLMITDPEGVRDEAFNYFFRETSRQINSLANRSNHTWGSRYYPSIITNDIHYKNVYKYIYYNPVKANLCKSVEEYPYSTLRGKIGLDHILIPTIEDIELFGPPTSIEKTLAWLNQPPVDNYWTNIKNGLKKSHFKLTCLNKAPHILNKSLL